MPDVVDKVMQTYGMMKTLSEEELEKARRSCWSSFLSGQEQMSIPLRSIA
jgi:hypothetical protein